MRRVSVSNVTAVVVALMAGVYLGQSEAEPPVVITRVDTVPYAAFRDSLKSERLEADGLRAKLAGRESRRPLTIVRTDTLVSPPDTVLALVRVRDGQLAVAPLIRADSLWAPELHRFDVRGCDDGWSWNAGALVCDRARFGHLSLYVEARGEAHPFGPLNPTAAVHAGLSWIPSYRSGWRASIAMAPTGRLTAAVAKGWGVW